jgi:hypothetical protein
MKNRKFTRIIALIMAAVMMMFVFAACSKKDDTTDQNEETEQKDEFRMLYNSIEPDEPVMKIGDVDMRWDVSYYAFYQEATELYSEYSQEIYDWTAEYQNGETYISYCMEEGIYNYLRFFAGVDHFAKEYNVELSADSLKQYEEGLASTIELYGSEQEMYDYLETKYMTPEVYEYVTKSEYLFNDVMDAAVGVNGEKLTEDDILALAETAYKMIKVIPLRISDESGNPVSREDKAAALETAQTILGELKAVPAAEQSAKFDELIDQYADPAMAEELKKGYVFTRGKYDTDVEKAIKDIEEGTLYDGVVEGGDNYYVVMRLPIDVEAYPYTGDGEFGTETLRVMYRDDIFNNMFWDWADNAEVEFYDVLNNMDIDAILASDEDN